MGMLHALGKDILAIEVGTNSNTTYRFYDYNRKDANGNGRPLHLEDSFAVTKASNVTHCLGDTECYRVDELFLENDLEIETKDSYFILSNMGQDATIVWEDEEIVLPKYDSMFVPYNADKVKIRKGAHLLYSRVKKG